jgi:hypothetical protein
MVLYRYGGLYIVGAALVEEVFKELASDVIFEEEREQEAGLEGEAAAILAEADQPPDPRVNQSKFEQRRAQLLASKAAPPSAQSSVESPKTVKEKLKTELNRWLLGLLLFCTSFILLLHLQDPGTWWIPGLQGES